MRIKFDGTLFTQEDMDELCVLLKEDGILLEPKRQHFRRQKGLPEMLESIPSWIAALENELLPILISSVLSYFLKKKNDDHTAIIRIEYCNGDEQRKLTIPTNQPLNMEIPFTPDQIMRIDIERSAPSEPEQNIEQP